MLNHFIVGTAYEGGIFKCKLVVDSEFPQKPPKGKLVLNRKFYRLFPDQDLPSKCCSAFRRNLCEHTQKGLESKFMVSDSHLWSYQVPIDRTIPWKFSEWGSRKRIHGKLWWFLQKRQSLHSSPCQAHSHSDEASRELHELTLQNHFRRAEAPSWKPNSVHQHWRKLFSVQHNALLLTAPLKQRSPQPSDQQLLAHILFCLWQSRWWYVNDELPKRAIYLRWNAEQATCILTVEPSCPEEGNRYCWLQEEVDEKDLKML